MVGLCAVEQFLSPDNGLEVNVASLGGLKFSGRDVLLAGVLMALGAGAITVQYVTLTAFQSALARDVLRVFQQADQADQDRKQIIGILQAKSCAEALTTNRKD